MANKHERVGRAGVTVKRTYEISEDLHFWLEDKAKAEGRSVLRQVERILEQERKIDLETRHLLGGA